LFKRRVYMYNVLVFSSFKYYYLTTRIFLSRPAALIRLDSNLPWQNPGIGFFPKVNQHFMYVDLDASAIRISSKLLFSLLFTQAFQQPTYPTSAANDGPQKIIFHRAVLSMHEWIRCTNVLHSHKSSVPLAQKTRLKRLSPLLGPSQRYKSQYSCSVLTPR